METKTILLIALILGGLLVVGIYSGIGKATISSSGTATIKETPDNVVVYFNVQVIDKSAENAKNKVAEIAANMKESLLDVVDEKDITTQQFSVYPNYNWNNGRQDINGYTASQQIEVRTERTDKVGRIIDKGVDAGALVSYINFELSDEKQAQAKAKALEQASEDAKTKAEAVAKGLGKHIGNIVSVTTSDFNYYPYRYWDAATGGVSAEKASIDIQPKDLEISATVQATFRIW